MKIMKNLRRKILKLKNLPVILFITLILLIIFLFLYFNQDLIPYREVFFGDIELPDSYYISSENFNFQKQQPYMCAGYSIAFVLRYYGLERAGEQSYWQMAYPFLPGVPPHRLISYLNLTGVSTSMYTGDLNDLKRHIVQDHPVIVLIGDGFNWQHYIVLLGYDSQKEELYFYDSDRYVNPYLVQGNRVISYNEFKRLWANGLPVYNRLYIPAYFAN